MAAITSARTFVRNVATVAEVSTSKARATRPAGFPRTAAFGMKASFKGARASAFMGASTKKIQGVRNGNRMATVMKVRHTGHWSLLGEKQCACGSQTASADRNS